MITATRKREARREISLANVSKTDRDYPQSSRKGQAFRLNDLFTTVKASSKNEQRKNFSDLPNSHSSASALSDRNSSLIPANSQGLFKRPERSNLRSTSSSRINSIQQISKLSPIKAIRSVRDFSTSTRHDDIQQPQEAREDRFPNYYASHSLNEMSNSLKKDSLAIRRSNIISSSIPELEEEPKEKIKRDTKFEFFHVRDEKFIDAFTDNINLFARRAQTSRGSVMTGSGMPLLTNRENQFVLPTRERRLLLKSDILQALKGIRQKSAIKFGEQFTSRKNMRPFSLTIFPKQDNPEPTIKKLAIPRASSQENFHKVPTMDFTNSKLIRDCRTSRSYEKNSSVRFTNPKEATPEKPTVTLNSHLQPKVKRRIASERTSYAVQSPHEKSDALGFTSKIQDFTRMRDNTDISSTKKSGPTEPKEEIKPSLSRNNQHVLNSQFHDGFRIEGWSLQNLNDDPENTLL